MDTQRQDYQSAVQHLSDSYTILLRMERLDGICMVGLDLGQLLCACGMSEEGRSILLRSRDGFEKLDQTDMVHRVDALLAEFPAAPTQPPE